MIFFIDNMMKNLNLGYLGSSIKRHIIDYIFMSDKDGNILCKNCIDCSNCYKCINCKNCEQCIDSKDSIHCRDSIQVINCKNCCWLLMANNIKSGTMEKGVDVNKLD